jgi:hypothetical protein
MNKKNMNLVLITSVIHCHPPDFLRSHYSPAQRLEQLVGLTVPSIREKIPNPYLVLVEGSPLSPPLRQHLLDSGIDDVMEYDARGINKGLGEALGLRLFFESDMLEALRGRISTISKITGRYFLTSEFRFHAYPPSAFVVKTRKCESSCSCGGGVFETRYYRFPVEYADTFRDRIALISEDKYDYEHQFYQKRLFPSGVHDRLHVAGALSYNGNFIFD